MAIIRKDLNCFPVPCHLAYDHTLSFEAKGLMMYLLSKPKGWQAHHAVIEQAGNISHDQFLKIIAELKAAGYLEQYQIFDLDSGYAIRIGSNK